MNPMFWHTNNDNKPFTSKEKERLDDHRRDFHRYPLLSREKNYLFNRDKIRWESKKNINDRRLERRLSRLFVLECHGSVIMPLSPEWDSDGRRKQWMISIKEVKTGKFIYMGEFKTHPLHIRLRLIDVIGSIARDAAYGSLDFEQFCIEMASNVDSREALTQWVTCRKLFKLFGRCEKVLSILNRAGY